MKVNIVIGKDITEINFDDIVSYKINNNDWSNFTLNHVYDWCDYFIQSFYGKQDKELTEKLYALSDSIVYDGDGQRYFMELSKLCYAMEI